MPDAPPLLRRPLPARGSEVLRIEGVWRRFGALTALKDVCFDVRAGEVVAVIGPNGAGKSTLFNQLSCCDKPTTGDIKFLGVSIVGRPSRFVAQRGLSRTFQHVKLLPEMTVVDNVALGAHCRLEIGMLRSALRLDRRDEARLMHEARVQIDRVGLAHLADIPAGSLSLGQQRLLEIARALASAPTLLLLDEPAAGLRHTEKEALAALLQKLRTEGVTILLVEHDMDFVMGLADRVIVMVFGEILTSGLPADVQSDPRVVEAYLGPEL